MFNVTRKRASSIQNLIANIYIFTITEVAADSSTT